MFRRTSETDSGVTGAIFAASFFFFSVGSLFFLLLRFWLTFPGSLLFEFLGKKKRGIQEANFPNHKEKPLLKNVPFVGEGGGNLYTDYRREVTEW